jgi:hypothetical protein
MIGRQEGAKQRSGRNPVLLFWVFIAATAALILAGCGNLSLNNVLTNESPGEFRLSPETVNLQVGKEFTFSATGGFTPYNYEILAGLGEVVKDQTWVYQAPDTITGDYVEVTIKATDQLGNSDTATVWVFKPFYIVGDTAVTIQLGGTVTIQADGGVLPYDWAFDDGTTNPDPEGDDPFDYTPTTEDTHVVGVTDDLGNYKEVTITVLPENVSLTIDPVLAGVEVGGTVSFAAFGVTPPYSWSATAGSITGTESAATFMAPSEPATVIITLSDASDSVTATVTVTSDTILPLVLSPNSPTVAAVGDTVQFSATDGVPPYIFRSDPSTHGSIDPDTGLYTQITAGKKVRVTVTDSVGSKDSACVYWAGP